LGLFSVTKASKPDDKDGHVSFRRIKSLASRLNNINRVIEHRLQVQEEFLFKAGDFRRIRAFGKGIYGFCSLMHKNSFKKKRQECRLVRIKFFMTIRKNICLRKLFVCYHMNATPLVVWCLIVSRQFNFTGKELFYFQQEISRIYAGVWRFANA